MTNSWVYTKTFVSPMGRNDYMYMVIDDDNFLYENFYALYIS